MFFYIRRNSPEFVSKADRVLIFIVNNSFVKATSLRTKYLPILNPVQTVLHDLDLPKMKKKVFLMQQEDIILIFFYYVNICSNFIIFRNSRSTFPNSLIKTVQKIFRIPTCCCNRVASFGTKLTTLYYLEINVLNNSFP